VIFLTGLVGFRHFADSGKKAVLALLATPLAMLVVSDAIIGNSFLFLWTWGSWLLIGLSYWLFRGLCNGSRRYFGALGFGVSATLLFYTITNFGVWTLGWYGLTLGGLLQSYVMALPFLPNQLLGNMLMTPLLVGVYDLVHYGLRAYSGSHKNEAYAL